ncbi:MAG: hypothetical protein AAFP00_14065 [Bacteroidota bacterium]
MRLNIEKKHQSFYRLEKLLIGDIPYWFYLYKISQNLQEDSLLIEVGPNNDEKDRRRWLFPNISDFKEFIDGEYEASIKFPQMILAIDLHENSVAVISCSDIEYSFEISELPIREYSS